MSLDLDSLEKLRTFHPAWRLLRADHAPWIASFLHRAFVVPNVRGMAAADLAAMLDDELYLLRQRLDAGALAKPASEYLNDWAAPERGWLRKYYRPGTDEPYFDLTPATEKALTWLAQLSERSFVGTESRLLTLFELLKQMSLGSEADPTKRIAALRERRDAIDAEIAQVLAGSVPLLDDTALKDRFQQFVQLARDLLSDFREVEHNFRQLDRRVRERIALWDGAKGALLEEIMGERDAIGSSDQGKSFQAFWDFLMSSQRQEELTELLDRVLALRPIADLNPDARTRRVHYDWLEAGEHTQRTVALLSQQLRRFLDDQAWLENRRIMDILHGIEAKALALRTTSPGGDVMAIPELSASVELPLERPLHIPNMKPVIADLALEDSIDEVDPSALFEQTVVDKGRLTRHIRHALQTRAGVTLGELVDGQPLQQGLAELVAYLQLGDEAFHAVVDDTGTETIDWEGVSSEGVNLRRRASLPRITFQDR